MADHTRRAVLASALALPVVSRTAAAEPSDYRTWDECEAIARRSAPRFRAHLRLIVALGRKSGRTPQDFLGEVIDRVGHHETERRA